MGVAVSAELDDGKFLHAVSRRVEGRDVGGVVEFPRIREIVSQSDTIGSGIAQRARDQMNSLVDFTGGNSRSRARLSCVELLELASSGVLPIV